jgi:hypothetical protein
MSRLFTYIVVSFFAVTALADEIDAEIIKHLDFFEQMPVVEDVDLIETEAFLGWRSRTGEKVAAGTENDADSLDDAVDAPSANQKQGGGQ